MFIEAMKSREISKEGSICQTRLKWWEESLQDVALNRGKDGKSQPREPITVVLKEAKEKTCINYSLV